MKKLSYLVIVMAIITMTACVDESFRLDEASTQIAIGGDVTTLPLGYLEKQKLGDFIDLDDVEGLSVDENGNYSLVFDGDGDEISIDGIETSFDIDKTVTTFSTEYPSFDITGEKLVINQPFSIVPNFGQLNIPQNVSVPISAGYTISAEEEGEISKSLEYSVPEYLAAIKRIYLKSQSGEKGAKVALSLNLGDIAVINGGGHVNLELVANDGYELYDKNGNELRVVKQEGNKTTYQIANNYTFASGAKNIEFVVYIASIANGASAENGMLSIPIDLGYHVSFDITTRANTLKLSTLPELNMNATFQFGDADIVLNEVVLLEHGTLANNSAPITIDNLPEEVKSVKRVSFSDNSPIHLFAEGLNWLEDVTAEHIIIEAQLPEYLTLHDDKQHGYDASTHILRTSLSDLRHKLHINLDALTFEGEGIKPEDGAITLDFVPDIAAYIEAGTETKLSKVLHNQAIEFSAGFENTTLELVSLEGKIAYKYEEETTIEMGDIEDDINLSIVDSGLSPVISINVDNPLTLDAKVSALLTPMFDGKENLENSVVIDNVVIKAATLVNGVIRSTTTKLILADESLRENYTDNQYTFVACDLGKLLVGNLPDEIKLSIAFATDEDASHEIYVTDSYSVNYSYGVNIPIIFNSGLDFTIEETVDDLADTFEDITEQDIAIESIGLVADIATTIPLDFAFDAELLDAQGKPTAVTLDIPKSNNKIMGSADGKSEANSTFSIGLNLGKSGNLKQLAEVDAIRFAFSAQRSNKGSAPLNAEQYISLKVKLKIDGKIKADLDNL